MAFIEEEFYFEGSENSTITFQILRLEENEKEHLEEDEPGKIIGIEMGWGESSISIDELEQLIYFLQKQHKRIKETYDNYGNGL